MTSTDFDILLTPARNGDADKWRCVITRSDVFHDARLDLGNPRERAAYLRDLAGKLGKTLDDVIFLDTAIMSRLETYLADADARAAAEVYADEPPPGFGGEPIPPEFGTTREPQPKPEAPKPAPPTALTVRELVLTYPELRKPSVYGLLREGETCNIIAPPKVGKSWLASDLALSKATGRDFLNFEVVPGNVLILDNELHGETSAHRLPRVAEARGIPFDDYADKIRVVNLRGCLCDVLGFGDIFAQFDPEWLRGAHVVLDAFYRALPKGISENDNASIAGVYNQIDRYAMSLNCSFVPIHHSTKGNQAAKSVVDVGAGAGSQARATDTHLVLRQHAELGHYTLDAAVRSWAPVEPLVLKWDWPVWSVAEGMDPAALKTDKPTPANRLETCKAAILKAFVHFPDGATKKALQRYTGRPTVWSEALTDLLESGDVIPCEINNPTHKKPDQGYRRIYTNGDEF